ncbi:hypothetical protein K4F52_000007 [Lecanicillium sp. MT-2017a]|nr:hypothetical protein K4F52_000007 [Lecanicillium sp. MT-2017a]
MPGGRRIRTAAPYNAALTQACAGVVLAVAVAASPIIDSRDDGHVLAARDPPETQDLSDEHLNMAEKIIEALGGGGPGGQTAIRGFFIGIAVGVVVAMLCCCWWPCMRMSPRDRREALSRLTRSGRRRRREQRAEEAAAPAAPEVAEAGAEGGGDGRRSTQGESAAERYRDNDEGPAEGYRDMADGAGAGTTTDYEPDADYEARRESARLQGIRGEEQGESHRDGERYAQRRQGSQS